MKIHRLRLRNYGPVRDFDFSPGTWELIYGGNESGKTALVEVLAYALLKRNLKLLRYGKAADLLLELEHDGAVFSAADKKAAGLLPAAEICSLHYVPASESDLYARDGQNFWEGIKIALSQSRAGMTYAYIIKKIYERTGIQAKEKDWTSAKKPLVTSRQERRQALVSYFTQMEKIDEIRQRTKQLAQECAALEQELKQLQDGKKYQEYKALKELFENYRANKNALADLQRYDESYLAAWQALETEKKSRQGIDHNLQSSREEQARIEKELAELKKQEEIIKRSGLENQLAPTMPPPAPTMFVPILLFLLGMLGLILCFRFRLPLLLPLALFGASILALAVVQYKKSAGYRARLKDELVLERARVLFPDLKDFNDLKDRIEKVRLERVRLEAVLEEKQKILSSLADDRLPDRLAEEINDLRNKTGLPELAELQKKIAEKRRRLDEQQVIRTQIQTLLREENENRWPDLIADRAVPEPLTAVDLKREPAVAAQLEKKRREQSDLQQRIEIFEASRREIHGVDDYRAAWQELNRLERELADLELEKKAAVKIEEVLTTLSRELDDFIAGIITGPNGLDEYFRLATGRYRSVQVHDRYLTVTDDAGREFDVEKLSSGTRDQLLLCFRLAALNKIYPGGTFLILDDALIFADWPRRQAMVSLLKQFSARGHQVIYLSSDDHTRDLFQTAGARITAI